MVVGVLRVQFFQKIANEDIIPVIDGLHTIHAQNNLLLSTSEELITSVVNSLFILTTPVKTLWF
jgi:hypothetical protein